MSTNRRQTAHDARVTAADLARDRAHAEHRANGDEQRYASAHYAMSFTKGLHHDEKTGLICDPEDFERFRRAIDEGVIDAFTDAVRPSPEKERAWEAPTAGISYDLQGPDPQAVTMAPAPELGSDELDYEMAEVYELALLRDEPLTNLAGAGSAAVQASLARLDKLAYAQRFDGRPRTVDAETGEVTAQTLFRGSSPGVEVGPYLSQFMLIGNSQPGRDGVDHGYVQYGALSIDQRVPVARPKSFLTDAATWLAAQNGKDLRNNRELFGKTSKVTRRFISTPRDLATYVHDDALYEAYLNACLILLSMRAPFDPAFNQLSGGGKLFRNSVHSKKRSIDKLEAHPRQAGGFALYGGPHILTLVTEVATRALKAVRYQKFNNHIRLRPEALAGRLHFAEAIEGAHPQIAGRFTGMATRLEETLDAVRSAAGCAFLPMAFQEGSPMHPSYGAGHATVAGACVTVLKAFFDTDAVFAHQLLDAEDPSKGSGDVVARILPEAAPMAYVPNGTGSALVPFDMGGTYLTLEGELNKLAANISIGRNMAGVHFYSDYYDSLRMGEQIAIGLLEEQALCYPTDPFVMSLPTFDGEVVRIGAR